jgi:hypothetical protein
MYIRAPKSTGITTRSIVNIHITGPELLQAMAEVLRSTALVLQGLFAGVLAELAINATNSGLNAMGKAPALTVLVRFLNEQK